HERAGHIEEIAEFDSVDGGYEYQRHSTTMRSPSCRMNPLLAGVPRVMSSYVKRTRIARGALRTTKMLLRDAYSVSPPALASAWAIEARGSRGNEPAWATSPSTDTTIG